MKLLYLLKFFFTILLSLQLSYGHAQKQSDSIAIRSLLEKESATWRSGDIKGHADCWQVRPYSRILISRGDSTVLDVPVSMMIDPPPGLTGKGGYAVLSDFIIKINDQNAWVSHKEESVATDGTKTFSYEIRLLEKVKGKWKLVGQSIHIYKPG